MLMQKCELSFVQIIVLAPTHPQHPGASQTSLGKNIPPLPATEVGHALVFPQHTPHTGAKPTF